MLALNILFGAPGELGCLQDWKTRGRTKLSKSLTFFLCWNVVGRSLSQLAGLWSQPCSQPSCPLSSASGAAAHSPNEGAGLGGAESSTASGALVPKGRDSRICFRIIPALCRKCWFPATGTSLLDQNLWGRCPRICISKNCLKLFTGPGMLEELQGRDNQGCRGRLASVHLWPRQLFHLPKSHLTHL